MLRDFIRTHVFERFPLFAGVCVGIAQGALITWGFAWAGGLHAVPLGSALAATAALTAAHAALMPRVGLARPERLLAALLEQVYLALGFGTIAVAGAIAVFTAAFALVVPLLAFAGVSASQGLTLFRVGSAAAGAIAAGALGFAFWVTPRRLSITHLRVSMSGLDPSLRGTRVVQLSDFHIGNGIEGRRLDQIVARANALEPDLIALTGDLFDHDPRFLAEGAAALGKLSAPLGVFAVLGNHDVMTGCDCVAEALATHAPGIRLLRDEVVQLAAAAPLHVAGVEDPGRDWSAHGHGLPALERVAAAISGSGPRILLVHRPDAFPQAAALGFGLVLSGHFHGGQLAFPIAEGRWNAARLLSPFSRGLYRADASVLYVTRGLGFAGPRIRFGSDPEIAILELDVAPTLGPAAP